MVDIVGNFFSHLDNLVLAATLFFSAAAAFITRRNREDIRPRDDLQPRGHVGPSDKRARRRRSDSSVSLMDLVLTTLDEVTRIHDRFDTVEDRLASIEERNRKKDARRRPSTAAAPKATFTGDADGI